jgi:asparagine synthase (glutamine-hydrolysing)
VLLAGDGSDELFGGYPWYTGARRLEVYQRLPFVGSAAGALAHLAPPGITRIKLDDLARRGRRPPHLQYLLTHAHLPRPAIRAILGLPLDAADAAIAHLAELFRPVAGLPLADQFAFADQMLWVREHFNQRLDRMTMLASVEGRVPFQDNEVVALAAPIPFHVKAGAGGPKRLLREAFRDVVPRAVLDRPKRPFAAPSQTWLEGALRPYAFDLLGEAAAGAAWPLDMRAVRDYAHPLLTAGFPDAHRAAGVIPLWRLLALVIWLRGQ